MDQHGVAERRHTRRFRPRGVCGYRPRHRPDTQRPSELDEYLREHPGIASLLAMLEQLSDDDLAKVKDGLEAEGRKLRHELPDFDEREAGEISRLCAKDTGRKDAERWRFETSLYRDFAMHQVMWMAARIEAGRRCERRDPLHLGPNRYGQMSKRFSRRWGHLRPSQINRHPVARRDIARELHGSAPRHRRAPGHKPVRRRGSRRTPAPTRGDPDDGDPEPPAPAPGARRHHRGGTSDQVAARRRPTRGVSA